MDAFLGKLTQHAMNYAIRSGIGITASFAISQSSRLLKTVDNKEDRQEIRSLQERLQIKTQIIGPAIDLIVLISARGNSTLESAVTLAKALRWDIQSLGARMQKAAIAEERSKQRKTQAKSRAAHEYEIRKITQDIRDLLIRIEEAVPLINLAITTSGATLSTQLPSSVSPSRLLQASTYLSAGDKVFFKRPDGPVQIGPTFTLSLYMLFAGHVIRPHELQNDIDGMRDTTWKEVIHKARVKLVRFSKDAPTLAVEQSSGKPPVETIETAQELSITGDAGAQYSYRFDIIEDLNDDRVHSFEEDEIQPGRYHDVALAGIREILPIYQISKIFYADTGKILNIGKLDEPNSPILLLKRDINARPSTLMMNEDEKADIWRDGPEDIVTPEEGGDESRGDIDEQLHRESSVNLTEAVDDLPEVVLEPWKFPADLDPEWLAFEVYTEAEDSETEDEEEVPDDSAYGSHRPSSFGDDKIEKSLIAGLTDLSIAPTSSPPPAKTSQQIIHSTPRPSIPPNSSPFGDMRFTSLSTLEMLIRLASVQEFKQQSHLTIPDELLSFFLQDSSTTGAGGDERQRRRTRLDAVNKVGFDPYNESPLQPRREKYQNHNQGQGEHQDTSREGTPYEYYQQRYSREVTPFDDQYQPSEDYGGPQGGYDILSPQWSSRERGSTPQGTPEPWLLRDKTHTNSSSSWQRALPSSPISPYRPRQVTARPLDRLVQQRDVKAGSPLGRGMSVETDSSLGTSPGSIGSPTLVDRQDKAAYDS